MHLDTVSGNEFDRLLLAHTLRVTGAGAEVDAGLADPARSGAILDDVNRLREECRRAKESLSVDTDTVVDVAVGVNVIVSAVLGGRRTVLGAALGAIFLIVCGLIPKVGAVIRTVPIEVLGGGVIVMFGMVVAAGISMLSDVNWNRRNMVIFAIALSLGLGLQLEPDALQYLPGTVKVLATSGILPAALIAIVLNLVLPQDLADESTEEVSGGMAGHGDGSLKQS